MVLLIVGVAVLCGVLGWQIGSHLVHHLGRLH
jgi:hypothetical protein